MPASVYLFLVALFVCSCAVKPTEPDPAPPNPSTASANVNGSDWPFKCVEGWLERSTPKLYLTLSENNCSMSSDRKISIRITEPRVATFWASNGVMSMTVLQPWRRLDADSSIGSGRVTIDSMTPTFVSGTFAVVAEHLWMSDSLVTTGEFKIYYSTPNVF